ncbi:MAG: hypothetical protein QM739_02535 [Propionivibrio sp.]
MLKASELEAWFGSAAVAKVAVQRSRNSSSAGKLRTAVGRVGSVQFQTGLRVFPATVFGFQFVGTSSEVGLYRCASFTAAANRSLNRTPQCCALGFPRLRLGAG